MNQTTLEILIEQNISGAIEFIHSHSYEAKSKVDRDKWCEVLTNDILKLDATSNYPDRKNTIIILQNILSELDHLFESTKPPILLSSQSSTRESYLPQGRDSHYALGKSFKH